MLLTTTDSLEGYVIDRYLGLVVGQAVIGEDMTKQFRTGIRDVAMGARHSYSQELDKARQEASEAMTEQAREMGATAVIGIQFDFETSGESSHLVIVSITGTAVVATPRRPGREAA